MSEKCSEGHMTFSKAVGTCLKKKYATFSGRASRAEFCYFLLFLLLMQLVILFGILPLSGVCLGLISGNSHSQEEFKSIGVVIYIVCNLPFVLPYLAVGARRHQDIGHPGWLIVVGHILFSFIFSLLLVAIVLSLCGTKGNEGPNRFGPPPDK